SRRSTSGTASTSPRGRSPARAGTSSHSPNNQTQPPRKRRRWWGPAPLFTRGDNRFAIEPAAKLWRYPDLRTGTILCGAGTNWPETKVGDPTRDVRLHQRRLDAGETSAASGVGRRAARELAGVGAPGASGREPGA